MIKKIGKLIICLMLFPLGLMANSSFEVRVDPSTPIVNEPFNIIVEVNASGSEVPQVQFNHGKLKVISEDSVVTGQTTIIRNGKVSSKRVYEYVYEVIASKTGTQYLRNFKIQIGNEKLKKMLYTFSVFKTQPKPKEVFVTVESSKNTIYLGEGIDVNYFVYASRKVRTGDPVVSEYPTFKGFFKRDYQMRTGWENVRHNGEMYRRVKIMSYRLYPQKTGTLNLPRIKAQIGIAQGHTSTSFGFFGGGVRVVTKNIFSNPTKINILPLPTLGAPSSGFTGLVGKHKFELSFPRTKVIVNEPIEATLRVEGEGLLESFDAPELFDNQAIESFDKKTTFSFDEKQIGKKEFSYTYIARDGVKIKSKDLNLYYFNANKKVYEKIDITVPELDVIGSAGTVVARQGGANVSNSNDASIVKNNIMNSVIAPEFSPRSKSKGNIVIYVIITLVLSLLYFIRRAFCLRERKITLKGEYLKMIKEVKKGRIDYPFVYQFVSVLEKVEEKKSSITELISSSGLTTETKEYFLLLIKNLEQIHYGDSDGVVISFKKKEFVKLIEYVAMNNKQ